MHDASCAIGIMAKAPMAGQSKTRLSPPLLAEQCAAFSAAFLHDTADSMALAARQAAIVSYAAYAPLGAEEILRPLIGNMPMILADGSSSAPPGVAGFGKCLLQAVQAMLGLGHQAACVLSSDIPTLPPRLLIEAAGILLAPGDHAVLGATHDGGYYILGMKAPHEHLFRNIAWSTSQVAAQTRERAREIGLTLFELDPWYDVDDAASLGALFEEREGHAAPWTRKILESLGPQALLQRNMVGKAS